MLPVGFQFSQSSLQDFVDCPRRFQLRYVQSQAWPGVQAEPFLEHERHLERGVHFHRLVERHQLGVDAAVLEAMIGDDPDLLGWWRSYLTFDFLHQLVGRRYPELTLSVDVLGRRLTATFDLLVVVPGGRIFVFDWKTYRSVPGRDWFAARLQTRVYSYVVASVGGALFGEGFSPELVTMVYWVAGESVVFDYGLESLLGDRDYLASLVSGVVDLLAVGGSWPLVCDVSWCGFCGYRSLCGRGAGAGDSLFWVEEGVVSSLGLIDVEEVGF